MGIMKGPFLVSLALFVALCQPNKFLIKTGSSDDDADYEDNGPDGFSKLMGMTLDQAEKILKENEICAGYDPYDPSRVFRQIRIVDQSYINEDMDVRRLHVTTENDKIVKIHKNEYDCDESNMTVMRDIKTFVIRKNVIYIT